MGTRLFFCRQKMGAHTSAHIYLKKNLFQLRTILALDFYSQIRFSFAALLYRGGLTPIAITKKVFELCSNQRYDIQADILPELTSPRPELLA